MVSWFHVLVIAVITIIVVLLRLVRSWEPMFVYECMRWWNAFLRHVCRHQDRLLTQLAIPTNPHICLASESPFLFVRQLEAELREHHDKIVADLQLMIKTTGRLGIAFGELDAHQQKFFGHIPTWRTFWLYFLQERVGPQQSLPTLMAILDKFQSHLGLAMISMLLPGTDIVTHTGPLKSVLRYHYPIFLPQDSDTGLMINGHAFRWQPRQGVLFDDTLPHRAWNQTKEVRIVLFMDVIRPLPWPFSWMNQRIYSWLRASGEMQQVRERLAKEGQKMD
jgi:ornithine lipid ester-linked acyl 2-hydroxylase